MRVPLNKPLRRRTDGLVEEYVEDDLFLVDISLGRIHHLNPVGAALWRQFEEPATLREVLDLFGTAFPDQSKTQLKSDLGGVIGELMEMELISPLGLTRT